MRYVNRLFILGMCLLLGCQSRAAEPREAARRLKVSDNRRYLVDGNGKPFFYLADTAWELFHRLSREEAENYLARRAEQGFTVVQAVALAELDGLGTPNAHGDLPLIENDPARPAVTEGSGAGAAEYDYWDHVDWIISAANAKGITVALLPSWGDKWNKAWGKGPEVFTPANAEAFGKFLGGRYKDKSIIWVLGGDRSITGDGHKAIIRAMAKGIAVGVSGSEDYSKVLMTFHPRGGETSATWFHADPWLSFNMQQNGHGINVPVWERVARELALEPKKPVMDGEPLYEDHPVAFKRPELGISDDYEVRKFAYWNLFSGAHGHTYGHHSVWQMHSFGKNGAGVNGPVFNWSEAIDRPGANQMRHVRALLESRPMLTRVPDNTVLASDLNKGADRLAATRDEAGTYAMIYSPLGLPFRVHLDRIKGAKVTASWFDPRTGKTTTAGVIEGKGQREFTPPTRGRGQDWVLILDDASRQYPAPGGV